MNRVWTEEELEILRRDRAEKVPIPVTAAKLGRPVPATYARARLIGTLVQPHQPWDEASVSRLRELVLADPPMTDKDIAAALERTVTQIRWKMQDLGLIGVRDLSKLARITASKSTEHKTVAPRPHKPVPARTKPVVKATAAAARAPSAAQSPAPVREAPPARMDFRTALDKALKQIENQLAERLKKSVAESEAGMIQAAKDAIAEKGRIDQRLAALVKQTPAKAEAKRVVSEAEPKPVTRKPVAETAKPARTAAPVPSAPKIERKIAPQTTPARPVPKPPVRQPAAAPVSSAIPSPAPVPVPSPVPAPAPKIVVMEAPAAARPVEPASTPAQVSGRGGWKSVRRDPAKIMAQSKAKATNRADAVDLAQAAQAAIERFIAERGVTRTEASGIPALVSRLQARGYIVVRDESGWTIDQRHRIDSESALVAFAEARGITLSAAA